MGPKIQITHQHLSGPDRVEFSALLPSGGVAHYLTFHNAESEAIGRWLSQGHPRGAALLTDAEYIAAISEAEAIMESHFGMIEHLHCPSTDAPRWCKHRI